MSKLVRIRRAPSLMLIATPTRSALHGAFFMRGGEVPFSLY